MKEKHKLKITNCQFEMQGQIQEFFIKGGGGGPKLVQKGLLIFCGKLLLTEITTRFSICERRLPLAREILLCEQRRTDHRRISKNNYIFQYPWNLV